MVCLPPRLLPPSATKLVTYSQLPKFSKPFPLSKITNQVYFLSLTVVCTQWIWQATDMPNSQDSMVETEEMSPPEWAGLWEWCKTVTRVLVRLSVWLEPLPRSTSKRNLSWKEALAQEITYPTEITINLDPCSSPQEDSEQFTRVNTGCRLIMEEIMTSGIKDLEWTTTHRKVTSEHFYFFTSIIIRNVNQIFN